MTTLEIRPAADELVAAIDDTEYARLLEWPRGRPLEGLLQDRAAASRAWYADHGEPWVAGRRLGLLRADDSGVTLVNGAVFHGREFSNRLTAGSAHAVVALALTAGPRVEVEAKRLWEAGRPDESYFLDRLGAAVAEQLLRWASVWVCRAAETEGETVLFHLSPGCGGWPFSEQPTLLGLLAEGGTRSIGPVTMLESGGLTPAHSLLAVLALTRRPATPTPADACRACDLPGCAFRRAPFRRTATQ